MSFPIKRTSASIFFNRFPDDRSGSSSINAVLARMSAVNTTNEGDADNPMPPPRSIENLASAAPASESIDSQALIGRQDLLMISPTSSTSSASEAAAPLSMETTSRQTTLKVEEQFLRSRPQASSTPSIEPITDDIMPSPLPFQENNTLSLISLLQSAKTPEEFMNIYVRLDRRLLDLLASAVTNMNHTEYSHHILTTRAQEILNQPAPKLIHHEGDTLLEQLQKFVATEMRFEKQEITTDEYKDILCRRFEAKLDSGLLRHQQLKALYKQLPSSVQRLVSKPPYYHSGLRKDLHLHFGPHQTGDDISFKVFAPNAKRIRLKVSRDNLSQNNFLYFPMTRSSDGTWYLKMPKVDLPALDGKIIYQYEITKQNREITDKADPFCHDDVAHIYSQTDGKETKTHYSVITSDMHRWSQEAELYMQSRQFNKDAPLNIYEAHPAIWNKQEYNTWKALAQPLASYLKENQFNAVELFGLLSHPLEKSWGYQISSLFAFNHRMGSSEDFKYLVDVLHANGIKIIADVVFTHFAVDSFGLEHFDGGNLYEINESSEWGTPLFDLKKQWVCDVMASSLTYLIEDCHIDGFRFDAVTEMLLKKEPSFSEEKTWDGRGLRSEGKKLIRELNALIHSYPGTFSIAEESAGFPGLTEDSEGTRTSYKEINKRGLGFDLAWGLGHKHFILKQFFRAKDKDFNTLLQGLELNPDRRLVHGVSHDDTGNGNSSLRHGMHGTVWQQFAQARLFQSLFTFLPGASLTMMGSELSQETEWSAHFSSHASDAVDWKSLESNTWADVEVSKGHYQTYPNLCKSMQKTVAQLGKLKLEHQALKGSNLSNNFTKLHTDENNHVLAFRRSSPDKQKNIMCVFNFKDNGFEKYFIPLTDVQSRSLTTMHLLFSSDDKSFGGNSQRQAVTYTAEKKDGNTTGITVQIPPYSCLVFDECFS